MQLQCQDALAQGLGVGVGEVQNQAAIHVVLNVVALGDDDHIIPLIDFE